MSQSTKIAAGLFGAVAAFALVACVGAAEPPEPAAPEIAELVVASEETESVNEDPAVDLTLCPEEDSPGCVWDASEQGNGVGVDVTNPPEETAPEPIDPVNPVGPGARQEYDRGTLECGVNAGVAVDQDEHGNWWAYCEPAMIEGN